MADDAMTTEELVLWAIDPEEMLEDTGGVCPLCGDEPEETNELEWGFQIKLECWYVQCACSVGYHPDRDKARRDWVRGLQAELRRRQRHERRMAQTEAEHGSH